MTTHDKNRYIEDVISWLESGKSKEEAIKILREDGVGIITADTIVSKSYNKVLKAYENELVKILKQDDSKDIEILIKEKVPFQFQEEVKSVIEKKYIREVRLDVISCLHSKVPIKNILSKYESSLVSRNQIKRWIISFYDNLNDRERLVKKSYMRVGVIVAVFFSYFSLSLHEISHLILVFLKLG